MKADMAALLSAKPRGAPRSTALPKPSSIASTRAPLESMRVAKPTQVEPIATERDWAVKADEAKARLAAEELEWQALLARAKAETAAAEAVEWAAMRERAAEATRAAEEREWRELMARARTSADALSPWPVAVAQRPREQPRIVLWP